MKKIKKSVWICVSMFLVVLIIIISYIALTKDDGVLQYGEYHNKKKLSYVEINEDGTFHFVIHIAMSIAVKGNYTVEGDILKLSSDVGEFKFRIKNKKLVFEEGNELTDERIKKGTKYIFDKKSFWDD